MSTATRFSSSTVSRIARPFFCRSASTMSIAFHACWQAKSLSSSVTPSSGPHDAKSWLLSSEGSVKVSAGST